MLHISRGILDIKREGIYFIISLHILLLLLIIMHELLQIALLTRLGLQCQTQDFGRGSSCCSCCDMGKTKSTPSPQTEVQTRDQSLTIVQVLICFISPPPSPPSPSLLLPLRSRWTILRSKYVFVFSQSTVLQTLVHLLIEIIFHQSTCSNSLLHFQRKQRPLHVSPFTFPASGCPKRSNPFFNFTRLGPQCKIPVQKACN